MWKFIIEHPWWSLFIVYIVLSSIFGGSDSQDEKTAGEKKHRYIGSVVQKGLTVYVYDEKGDYLFDKGGQLVGFTSTTVSVQSGGGGVWVYDEKGNSLFSDMSS